MDTPGKTSISTLLSDEPIGINGQKDSLGFSKYAKVLANLAQTTPGPFTIGIHAEWGYGKTSLLRKIENFVDADSSMSNKTVTVWFNAWQYESEESPLVSMILTINNAIDEKIENDSNLSPKTKKVFLEARDMLGRVAKGALSSSTISTTVRVPFLYAAELSVSGDKLADAAGNNKSPSAAGMVTSELEQRAIYYKAIKSLNKTCKRLTDQGVKIIVFVDDLDRCTPEKAFRLLQDVKLILGQPGFIFFMGLALENLRSYLKSNYDDGDRYLHKIIQVPFYIPPHQAQYISFIDKLLDGIAIENKQVFTDILHSLSFALYFNPRDIKRMINTVQLLNRIYDSDAQLQHSNSMLLFFAVEVFLRVYYFEFYVLLTGCTDDNLVSISMWKYESKKDEATGAKEERIWDVLEADEELRKLFDSEIGREWLKKENAVKRSMARDLTNEQQVSATDFGIDYSELLVKTRSALDSGNLEQARSIATRAIGHGPERCEAYWFRAQAYQREQKWTEAIQDLKHAVNLSPKYPLFLRELGRSYRKAGNYQHAAKVLSDAIHTLPEEAGLYIERGIVYYQQDQPEYKLAFADFETAEKLDTQNLEADIHYRTAHALRRQAGGKRMDKQLRSKVVPLLKRELELHPSHSKAREWLQSLLNE